MKNRFASCGFCLLCVIVFLGGVHGQTKELPLPGDVFTVAGRTAFVIEPGTEVRSSGALPWVWYAPTLRGLPAKEERWMFERFLAEGIAIAGIDVGESFGSPDGRASYQALYEHLTTRRGYGKKPVLLARSRGGLMLYNWAAEHPESVSGVAGIYPVCNLASYPGMSRAAPAFGMTPEELDATLKDHNPVERLAGLARANVPILHIHGDNDRTVPLPENSALLHERYEALGGPMDLSVLAGLGHDMNPRWFQSEKLTKFVIERARASLAADEKTVRVFIFAGQSNMVGSDSRATDIARFPPFVGLEAPQTKVRFSYCIGREDKLRSEGFVPLQPVNGVVGPELSFARRVTAHSPGEVAIIKVAAGGTHLGGDWNPDTPIGFEMYPLALKWVKDALSDLDRQKIPYRLEGFMWHQGENDMFDETYMANYGKNLANFLARWRADLGTPDLKFYIGELCTKTIWGMDLRPRMHAISVGQKAVCRDDPHAQYVPTSHVGVEIGGGVGLHYHYGTLGQLEHGWNYADAYLRSIGRLPTIDRKLTKWPYPAKSKVKLFVLAGHRNMEGERAFVADLKKIKGSSRLVKDDPKIAYRYDVAGGYKVSNGFEPLGPAGCYDTFGPELSFGATLSKRTKGPLAIAKFTHSGSQLLDWTPEGSMAVTRNLYQPFIEFVRSSIKELEDRGHDVELAGVFYHLGENDMSFGPHRQHAPARLKAVIEQSREDLKLPELRWFVSQQPPTNHESVNGIDVTSAIARLAETDRHLIHVKAFDLPAEKEQLVLTAQGIVALGELLAESYLAER